VLVEEAREAFVDHPDLGSDPFMVKLGRQMEGHSPGAKQLMAEMLWALLLFPSNMRAMRKRAVVTEAWGWSGQALLPTHALLADDVLVGIGSGGTAFHSLRYAARGDEVQQVRVADREERRAQRLDQRQAVRRVVDGAEHRRQRQHLGSREVLLAADQAVAEPKRPTLS